MTEKDLIKLLETGIQINEEALKNDSFLTKNDNEIRKLVIEYLLPTIEDIRIRKIVWSRSKGICWKLISKETKLSVRHNISLFHRGINAILASI